MNIIVILAHPDSSSFNHAVALTAAAELKKSGHKVVLHDLYAEGFDPFLEKEEISRDFEPDPVVAMHCKELKEADGIIIVHPNWWGQPPAVLKGWIDRIIRPGVAYRFLEGDSGEGVPEGLLKAKSVIVFNTSNTSALREANVFGDPLENIWKQCIFNFCGVDDVERRIFRTIVTSTEDERKNWLEEVRSLVNEKYPCS